MDEVEDDEVEDDDESDMYEHKYDQVQSHPEQSAQHANAVSVEQPMHRSDVETANVASEESHNTEGDNDNDNDNDNVAMAVDAEEIVMSPLHYSESQDDEIMLDDMGRINLV